MRLSLAVALAALATNAAAQEAVDTTPVTVLRAARLFDGRGDSILTNAVVTISAGRIQAVGSGLDVPPGASVVELGDATLLPGFIDAHVHLAGESGDDWYRDAVEGMRRSVAERAIRATAHARKALHAGFTSVRNVGAGDYIDIGLRNAIDAGVVEGPRMLTAAYSLGARGGHCDETGFPYNFFGYETGIAQGIASGADQFRDAVRIQHKYGASVIKVCATGGVLSLGDAVDTPQLTQAEMDALVDEAHRLGLKAAAHAHGAEGAKAAIRAGIDSIEHGSFLDDEAHRMMRQRGTYLVPTAMAVDYTGRRRPRNYPEEIARKARAAADAHADALRRAIQMGVKIAFGTDSAVSPHGRNAQEFRLLVEHGMSPAAALRTAGPAAAELLGLSKEIGSLEVGKAADIVAVPGDVLADVTATERVFLVMKGGKLYRNDRAR